MKKLNEQLIIELHRQYLASRGYKEKTVRMKRGYLKKFLKYLGTTKHTYDIRDITEKVISEYILYLEGLISEKRNKTLSVITRNQMVVAVKELFKSLYVNDYILTNPAQGITLKRCKSYEKRAILDQKEMELVLDSIDSLRDRTMYELAYSTGLRVSEIVNLKINDIDVDNRLIRINRGKFSKDRIEPVTEVSMSFLKKYLWGRWRKKDEYVFPGRGGKTGKSTVNAHFKKWSANAGVKKKNLCAHSIRHTIATHLLEQGLDVRYVQELLGHESIETTVQYTHMMYENMKRIYKSYHPRENEYYEEVSQEYVNRLNGLKEQLKARLEKTGRDRRWREKKTEKQI